MIKLIFSLILIHTLSVVAYSHPGRTASDGCHYCRTNCEKWGVPRGVRHCHGGKEQILQKVKEIQIKEKAQNFKNKNKIQIHKIKSTIPLIKNTKSLTKTKP